MSTLKLESLLPSLRLPSFESALELNWCSWVLTHGLPPERGFLVREQDNLRVITGEPDGFLNWVAWSDIPVAAMDTRIEEISGNIRRRLSGRSVSCEWSVLGSQPNRQSLVEALKRAGWEFSYEVPAMTCDLTGDAVRFDDGSREFRVVRTSRDVSLWLHPFMEAFGIQERSRAHLQRCFEIIAADRKHPFQHFLLLSPYGEPITSGSIKYRYGEAVIYNIASLGSARGAGGATAMVRLLKNEAFREGYSRVSLFALPEGRRIYEKAGFQANSASYAVFNRRF